MTYLLLSILHWLAGASDAGALFYLPAVVGLGGVFAKAGRPWVAAFVPVWSELELVALIGRNRLWVLALLAVLPDRIGVLATGSPLWASQGMPGIGAVLALVCLFAQCAALVLLCERFATGIGHYLGVVLLPMVFLPVLGFGPREYRPPFRRRRGRVSSGAGSRPARAAFPAGPR